MSRSTVWTGLLLCAALIVAERWHTRAEPLETDLGIYAVMGHGLLEGRVLYADLWDRKPPAVHVTYAAGELLAAYGPQSVLLINIVAALATMLGLYYAGSTSRFGYVGGLAAAGFWTIVCGDLKLQANQPNSEVFINCFLIWAFAILVAKRPSGLGYRRAVLVGLLFAMATLYKHVAIAPAGCLALAHCLGKPAQTTRRQTFVEAGIMLAVVAVVWIAMCGYFFYVGRWQPFYEAVFAYNIRYAGSPIQSAWPGFFSDTPFVAALAAAEPLAGLAGMGLVVGLLLGPARPWRLWIAFAIGTQVAVYLPNRPYPHYWQLWLPPLAVAAGWAIASGTSIPKILSIPLPRIAQACLPLVLLLCQSPLGLVLLIAAVPLCNVRRPSGQPIRWARLRLGSITVALFGAALLQPYVGNMWFIWLALAWGLVGLQDMALPKYYWLPVFVAFGALLLNAPFTIWLPAAALALVAITPFVTGSQGHTSRLLTGMAAVVAGLLLLSVQAPLYRLSPEEWSEAKYGGCYTSTKQASARINELLEPEEAFYELGSHTGLYFYSGRLPPAGVFYDFPLGFSPFSQSLCQRILDDLERTRPELWIFSNYQEADQPGTQQIQNWVSSHYQPAAHIDNIGPFRFWVLRGGKLEKRLAEQSQSQPQTSNGAS
jgi:hypothetical protein